MAPKKGSKALQKKNSFIGQFSKNKKRLSLIEVTLQQQESELQKAYLVQEEKVKVELKLHEENLKVELKAQKERLQDILKEQEKVDEELRVQKRKLDATYHRLQYKKKLDDLSLEETNEKSSKEPVTIRISKKKKNARLQNPTSEETRLRSKVRRRTETFQTCEVIHGGTSENIEPTVSGMLQTVTARCKAKYLACKVLKSKPSFVNELSQSCIRKHNKDFYNSEQNLLRSLNVYYSSNVMGKRKFLSVRKANKAPDVINFVSYKRLSEYINTIDIGVVKNVSPELTADIEVDEICAGMFRELSDFAVRLAKFYLHVNTQRHDKLHEFENFNRKDPSSVMFLMSLGGDEAPGSGTAF